MQDLKEKSPSLVLHVTLSVSLTKSSYYVLLRGEKLNYKSVAKEISKPPFLGS